MSKMLATFNVTPEAHSQLRSTATALGASMSEIVDLALLTSIVTPEFAQELSQRRQARSVAKAEGPAAKPLVKRERMALEALDRLVLKDAEAEGIMNGNKWFPLKRISHEAGLYPSEAIQGLRGLESRGILMCDEMATIPDLQAFGDAAPKREHWAHIPEDRRK